MVSLADRYQLLYFEIHGVVHAEITFLLECSLALTDSGEGRKEVEPGHLCAVQDFSYGLLYLGLLHWPDQRSVRTTSESVLFLPTLLPSLLPFRGISMPAPFKGSPHIQCLNFALSLTLYRCFFSSLANLVLSYHLLLRGLELTEGINKI